MHDFNPKEINDIVKTYKQEPESCSEQAVFAFRAGGWCLQPFEQIKSALKANDIWLDSTVFSQGHSDEPSRWFNFNTIPKQAYWYFDNDPLKQQQDGYFTELPISATKTSPLFFWKLALRKKLPSRLFMIDGSKAGQLEKAFQEHLEQADQDSIFNIMGHPKSLSPYSLIKLEQFLQLHSELDSITYQDLKHLKKHRTFPR
ncbi:hypothetical protein ACPSKX_03750 [Moritella viscosa]